jgi:hypothetical protein
MLEKHAILQLELVLTELAFSFAALLLCVKAFGKLPNINSLPVSAIQRTILDGFRHMMGLNSSALLKVGDGARHTENAVIGTGGQSDARNGVFHLLL